MIKEFLKKPPFSPTQLARYLYIVFVLMFLIELFSDSIWGRDSHISFTIRTVAMTIRWICILIALPLVIVGQKRWTTHSILALAASLLLMTSMLIDFHRALFAWLGISILLLMLLWHLIPRAWNFFAKSYREISQKS